MHGTRMYTLIVVAFIGLFTIPKCPASRFYQPVEEGKSYSLDCNPGARGEQCIALKHEKELRCGPPFLLYHCSCSNVETHCHVGTEEGQSAMTVDLRTVHLNITNITRRSNCYFRGPNCHLKLPLEIFAKPENPVCDAPIVNTSTNQLELTCSTNKTYPKAGCQFLYSTDNEDFQELVGHITYNHTPWNDTIEYFQSDCTLSTTILGSYSVYFKVLMYPKLNHSNQRFNVSSNIVHFTNLEEYTEDFPDENNSQDQTAVAVLSVFLALVIVVAVVFAILWLRTRVREQLQNSETVEPPKVEDIKPPASPPKKIESTYFEKPVTEGDAVESYEGMSFGPQSDGPASSEIYGNDIALVDNRVAEAEDLATAPDNHLYGNVQLCRDAQAQSRASSKRKMANYDVPPTRQDDQNVYKELQDESTSQRRSKRRQRQHQM